MKKTENYLKDKARQLRKEIITMSFEGHGHHISSCLSIADILTVLYYSVLKINPKKPNNPNRDRFILSKGHAAAAIYAVLSDRGFFPKKYLQTYGKEGTLLGIHPEYGHLAGIELSTGSLGHGLSVGAGLALAAKLNRRAFKTFVLLSDGECDEGSVWESALFASHHKLDNLVAIVDYNKFQAFGKVKDVLNLDPLSKKWQSFGWHTQEIDGHNIKDLLKSLKAIGAKKNKPTAIIAHTIAGKGVSYMQNRQEWHYLNLSFQQYKKAILELNSQ